MEQKTRLNKKLYKKEAVETAAKEISVSARIKIADSTDYYEVTICSEEPDLAEEFANYCLALSR